MPVAYTNLCNHAFWWESAWRSQTHHFSHRCWSLARITNLPTHEPASPLSHQLCSLRPWLRPGIHRVPRACGHNQGVHAVCDSSRARVVGRNGTCFLYAKGRGQQGLGFMHRVGKVQKPATHCAKALRRRCLGCLELLASLQLCLQQRNQIATQIPSRYLRFRVFWDRFFRGIHRTAVPPRV